MLKFELSQLRFKCAFKIYGIWPQAKKYVTNTLLQCSPASVGLAQARPNYGIFGASLSDTLIICDIQSETLIWKSVAGLHGNI